MCRSQYLWSPTASLEHRHFLPSVRRHLPCSTSAQPGRNCAHPTTKQSLQYMSKCHKTYI
ncbi:hypothetical protein PR202_ga22198 [Eleusine coracana subsp. coracana]|uniref:Uncharacterized protein n=1 Tax=Eleusine coracana subsp. coracana TaxID=191504 RepID=A0AAV5D0Z9_ELECO|nr:hypothetical protein PR202_ga22198 [Eleusine coracana subsp. coracana]